MTDFLSGLVQKSFGTPAAIRPRLAFLFEPAFPHREPAPETSSLREGDSASGVRERDLVRPTAVRPDEPVQDSGLTRRPETDDHTALVQDELPASRPHVSAAPPQPAPARRLMQAAGEATDPPPRILARDIRQDEDARVVPRHHATTAARSADNVSPPELPEIAARAEESGRSEDRGLLVPSRLGARIAADLQSSVAAANVRSRGRGLDPQRAAEGPHTSAERNVQVTIGRIEVRATGADRTAVRERSASPVMGLDEYLKRQARRGGQ
jgi:hypothetical protein